MDCHTDKNSSCHLANPCAFIGNPTNLRSLDGDDAGLKAYPWKVSRYVLSLRGGAR